MKIHINTYIFIYCSYYIVSDREHLLARCQVETTKWMTHFGTPPSLLPKLDIILLPLLKISTRTFQSWHSRLKTCTSVQASRLRRYWEGNLVPYTNSFWGSDRIFRFMAKLEFFPHILSYHKFLGMNLWGPKENKAKKKLYLYQVDADSLNQRLSAL